MATSIGPAYATLASATATAGSYHGGTWVITSRPTCAAGSRDPAVGAGQVDVRRVGLAGHERRLGQQQVGAGGQPVEAEAGSGVAGVRERAAARGDPQPVRRHGVHHRHGLDRERTDLDRLAVDVGSRTPRSSPAPPGSPYAAASRSAVPAGPHTGSRGCGPVGVVLAQDVVAAEVQAVVGVQVADRKTASIASGST